jgi:hypothetical protein
MKVRSYARFLLVVVVGLVGASGCERRGTFTADACKVDETPAGRMDVPVEAASAVYFNKSGNPIGVLAEDLVGTKDNKMCPTPPVGGPGGCSPKPPWCVVNVNGTNYCLRC